jgi:type IV pilus assembly protein PilW
MKTKTIQQGLSMIELLVALAIGSFLIIGAVTLQSNTRATFAVNEQNARLQETARYVISVLGPEISLAGMYGYSNDPNSMKYELGGSTYYAADMRQGRPVPTGILPALNACGDNYVIDVSRTVQVQDNTYALPCAAAGGGHRAGTDVLTLRRSSVEDTAPTGTKLQMYTNRRLPMDQRLFISTTPPMLPLAETKETRDLLTQIYYVSVNSESRPGIPALRVKQLGEGPAWTDQEIVRGVEDLQFEFGVDPGRDENPMDGTIDDLGGDGMADNVYGEALRYVLPGSPVLASGQVVSVRMWIRVRSELPEVGFVDNRPYVYASTNFTPNDNFRRVLMSRTVFLRNTRQFKDRPSGT